MEQWEYLTLRINRRAAEGKGLSKKFVFVDTQEFLRS